MKRFQSKRGMFFLALLLIIILVAYYLLSNSSPQKKEDIIITNVQELLLRDLEKNYPPSPKEVVKYYSEITKAFYEEMTTTEEIELLARKSRDLFDEELKASMTEDEYLIALKLEIESFQEDGLKVTSYSLSDSVDVEYFSEDGYKFARLHTVCTLMQGTTIKSVIETFVLREDKEGHWKIYGWDITKEE